jgi:hypothetical protein
MNKSFANALNIIGTVLITAGALFKIMHWPMGSWLLMAGLANGLLGWVALGYIKYNNPKGE